MQTPKHRSEKMKLVLFKFLVHNEKYGHLLEIPNLFRHLPGWYDELSTNKELEELRTLFCRYRDKWDKFPQFLSQDLSDALAEGEYKELGQGILEQYFDIDINLWDKDVILKEGRAQIQKAYLSIQINEAFKKAQDAEDHEMGLDQMLTHLKSATSKIELEKSPICSGIIDPRFYSEENRTKILSKFTTINQFLSPSEQSEDGGYLIGGLYSFLAQPKAGKSTFLANEAGHFSLIGQHVAIATFEMSDKEYHERVVCSTYGIERSQYHDLKKRGELMKWVSTKKAEIETKLGQTLGNVYIQRFTNDQKPEDVLTWVLNLEKSHNIKISVVIVDYINIMSDGKSGAKSSDQTYMKIKSIAESLRSYGITNNWATITATQVNRTGTFVEELDPTHVSESYGLTATVDALIGIISVKNIPRQRKLQCVTSRTSGSNSIVPVHMDWTNWGIREFMGINPGEEAMKNLFSQN